MAGGSEMAGSGTHPQPATVSGVAGSLEGRWVALATLLLVA